MLHDVPDWASRFYVYTHSNSSPRKIGQKNLLKKCAGSGRKSMPPHTVLRDISTTDADKLKAFRDVLYRV